MILRIPRNFIFPLTTLAFVAIPVDYVDIVFTTTTRWVFLVALTLYLFARRRLFLGMQSYAGIALLLYCAWCLSTYTWSLVPQLSLEKAGAFSLLAVTFVSAGQDWVHERGAQRALNFLAPITVIGLLAAFGGRVASDGAGPGHLGAVEGLTDNPNMLGSLLAMTLPLLVWSAYKYRAHPQTRWIFFLLLAAAIVLLARTHSRSAILSAGMLGFVFCLSLTLPRSTFILLLIASSLFVAAAASTAVLEITYEDYVLKGGTQGQGILFSREGVWLQSYENAKEGGWYGVGYGATTGDTYFQGGFTAVGYGREKGNAQLAIVEETGLVGLGLYSILMLGLFSPLIGAHRRERNPDMKVALGIIIGTLAGLTAMSVFEAWWVAPGSPESAYFWSLGGVGLALARKSRQAANVAAPTPPFTPAPPLPAKVALSERRARG
jgi:hypothetical protein